MIKDRRIRYYYFPHRGRPYARNEGLKRVTGKYICFLDSDDIMLPQNLELKVNYAETERLKLIFSDYFRVSSDDMDFTDVTKIKPFLKNIGYTLWIFV